MSMLKPAHNRSRDWTVLYYGGGVNNLEEDIREAWTSLGEEKLPSNVDTFVRHIDREGHSKDVHIGTDGSQTVIASNPKPVDSSDSESLAEFIKKGVSTYPAAHYLVVISSHGRGAEGAVEDDLQKAIMRPHEIKAAFEAGKTANSGQPLDAVLFDACRMAAVEVAHELAGSVLVSVASMDSIADMGYDLNEVLNVASVSDSAIELGQRLVNSGDPQLLDALNSISAVDLSQVSELSNAWGQMVEAIKHLDSAGLEALGLHARQSRRNRASPMAEYGNDLLADSILASPERDNDSALELWLQNEAPGEAVSMMSFCGRILKDGKLSDRYPELEDAAKRVIANHDRAVYQYRAQDRNEDPGGLTVLMPLNNEEGPLYHSPLAFAHSTKWETAYDAVLPDGEAFPTEKTWLERKLELPDK
jgi:cysteine peptidase C11 family protein